MEEREEEEDEFTVSHSSEALPASPAYSLRQAMAEEEQNSQKPHKEGFAFPTMGLRGQVSDQKSDGKVLMTKAVQALKVSRSARHGKQAVCENPRNVLWLMWYNGTRDLYLFI